MAEPLEAYEPGKTVLDLAIAVAAAQTECRMGQCYAPSQGVRPGRGGSDALPADHHITAIATDAPKVLSALVSARAAAQSVRSRRGPTPHGWESCTRTRVMTPETV